MGEPEYRMLSPEEAERRKRIRERLREAVPVPAKGAKPVEIALNELGKRILQIIVRGESTLYRYKPAEKKLLIDFFEKDVGQRRNFDVSGMKESAVKEIHPGFSLVEFLDKAALFFPGLALALAKKFGVKKYKAPEAGALVFIVDKDNESLLKMVEWKKAEGETYAYDASAGAFKSRKRDLSREEKIEFIRAVFGQDFKELAESMSGKGGIDYAFEIVAAKR